LFRVTCISRLPPLHLPTSDWDNLSPFLFPAYRGASFLSVQVKVPIFFRCASLFAPPSPRLFSLISILDPFCLFFGGDTPLVFIFPAHLHDTSFHLPFQRRSSPPFILSPCPHPCLANFSNSPAVSPPFFFLPFFPLRFSVQPRVIFRPNTPERELAFLLCPSFMVCCMRSSDNVSLPHQCCFFFPSVLMLGIFRDVTLCRPGPPGLCRAFDHELLVAPLSPRYRASLDSFSLV